MSLRCQLCGKEIFYDQKLCHRCEESALKSKLVKHNYNWRCDNFLEINSLAFGNNLELHSKLRPKLHACPACGEEYLYDEKIIHVCRYNSVPFGKILLDKYRMRKWNCQTTMACTELPLLELETIESGVDLPLLEKLERIEYKWNEISNMEFNNVIDKKNKLLIYE